MQTLLQFLGDYRYEVKQLYAQFNVVSADDDLNANKCCNAYNSSDKLSLEVSR